jgi:hypothetical protein
MLFLCLENPNAIPPRMELSVESCRKNYWAKNNQTKYL